MSTSLFGWLGTVTPEKRAKSEIECLDRLIYDVQKSLHNAQAQLDYLLDRRDFLLEEYVLGAHQHSSRQGGAPEVVPGTASLGEMAEMFNKRSRL